MNLPSAQTPSVEELQRQLQQKSELVSALTQQLEGTVEQLDRLQRAGVKAGSESSSKGVGLLSQQIESALEAFDELAPADHFVRIESGIDQILRMLSQGKFPTDIASASHDETQQVGSTATEEEDSPLEQPATRQTRPSANDDDFWEAAKKRLLAESQTENPEETELEEADSPQHSEVAGSSEPAHFSTTDYDDAPEAEPQHDQAKSNVDQLFAIFDLPPLPKAPQPVLKPLDSELFEEALTARDLYISALLARLRQLESIPFQRVNWERLNQAPTELVEVLQARQRQLDEHLRQAEVAVALDRAELTRERSKLMHVKQHLEQEVKRLSFSGNPESEPSPESEAEHSRWTKFFNLKK